MANKITKAQRFNDIKALLTGNEVQYGTDIETAIKVIDHELELLAKKNSGESKKQAETQKVNTGIKEEIVSLLGELDDGNPGMTCTEIIKAKGWSELYTTSKISSLLRQLKIEDKVIADKVKGKMLFKLA